MTWFNEISKSFGARSMEGLRPNNKKQLKEEIKIKLVNLEWSINQHEPVHENFQNLKYAINKYLEG